MLLSILGADDLRKHFQEVQMIKVRNAIFVIIYALIKLFFRSFCMNTVRIQILLNRAHTGEDPSNATTVTSSLLRQAV